MAGNFIKVGKWGECLWGIDENGNLLIDKGEAMSIKKLLIPILIVLIVGIMMLCESKVYA